MTEADILFLARDCSVEILKEFAAPPFFEEEDIGKDTFGTIVGVIKTRTDTFVRLSPATFVDRDDFRRRAQDLIEVTIRRALTKQAEDAIRQWGKP